MIGVSLTLCFESRTLLRLVSKASATLIASSLQNFASVCCGHSLSEAVFLASLSLLGLICSKHIRTSFYILTFFNLKSNIPIDIDQ